MLRQTLLPLLAALVLLSSSSTTHASVSTVLKDFASIQNQTLHLERETRNFTGGGAEIEQALQIQTDAQSLDGTINQTTADSGALSAPLDDGDSASIANAVTGLQQGVFGALDALAAKKAAFASIAPAVVGLVEQSLVRLQKDTRSLAKTVSPKLDSVLAKLAPLITDNIDFHFQRVVDEYASQ